MRPGRTVGWAAGAAALLLAGCTVGPDFHRPDPAAPAAFGGMPTDVASPTIGGTVDTRWWQGFDDAELSSLVERLARQNLDLQAAAERVAEARAVRDVVAAQGLPNLSAVPSYQRVRISPEGSPSALVEPVPGAPLMFNQFDGSAQASWELDLFGRIRRQVEAAGAQADAAVAARRALALSAISDLAQLYCQYRAAQAQEAIVRRNLQLADRRRALVRDRFANGVATTLEVAQADAQGLAIAQDLPSILAQQASLANAIGLLLSEPPRSLQAELARPRPQPLVPPAVPVGVPADLTRRRPDVAQAEDQLHAATAQTGVAVADFFPRVTLTGSAGFQNLPGFTPLGWAARQFMVGPSVNLPIFQGGRLRATLALREAGQREAALRYRQVVLQAWHEVDTALTNYAQAQHLRTAAFDTEQANARALAAADQQYVEGISTLLNVVTAQEAVLRGENAVVQAQLGVETRLVQLYRALGGGWETVPDAPPPPRTRTGMGALLHYQAPTATPPR